MSEASTPGPAGGTAASVSVHRLLGVVLAGAPSVADVEYAVSGRVAAALSAHDEGSSARELLRQHVEMVDRLFDVGPILPARYGILVSDRTELVGGFVAPHEQALAQSLHEVAGRAEFRVRIDQDEQGAVTEAVRRDPSLRGLGRVARTDTDTSPYGARVVLGERVARVVADVAESDVETVVNLLAPFAVSVRGSAPPTSRVVFDASYLVEMERYDDFDAAVGQVIDALGARAKVTATGPMAPYSFTDLLAAR
jgi:hypothetical protein